MARLISPSSSVSKSPPKKRPEPVAEPAKSCMAKRTSSYKTKPQSGYGTGRRYKATKITVNKSTVVDLVSKFNAVLLDEHNEADKLYVKRIQHERNSVEKTIKLFEKDQHQKKPNMVLYKKESTLEKPMKRNSFDSADKILKKARSQLKPVPEKPNIKPKPKVENSPGNVENKSVKSGESTVVPRRPVSEMFKNDQIMVPRRPVSEVLKNNPLWKFCSGTEIISQHERSGDEKTNIDIATKEPSPTLVITKVGNLGELKKPRLKMSDDDSKDNQVENPTKCAPTIAAIPLSKKIEVNKSALYNSLPNLECTRMNSLSDSGHTEARRIDQKELMNELSPASILKSKRLSIAKDSGLESALNGSMMQKTEANVSFLHKYLDIDKTVHKSSSDESVRLPLAVDENKNTCLYSTITRPVFSDSDNVYESVYETGYNEIDNPYDTCKERGQEFDSDNVEYAKLNDYDSVCQKSKYANYEPAEIYAPSSSGSSIDKTNSLYGEKQSSIEQRSSSSISAGSRDKTDVSYSCSVPVFQSNSCTSSSFGDQLTENGSWVSDQWVSDEEHMDDDHLQVIVYRRLNALKHHFRTFRKRIKKRKRKLFHKKVAAHAGTKPVDMSFDEVEDDFDDSEGESDQHKSYSLNETLPEVPRSQNVYNLVAKARRKVRKSLSSLNQIRKSSAGSITSSNRSKSASPECNRKDSSSVANISEINQNIDSKKTSATNGKQLRNGTRSLRWSSFKSKLRPSFTTVSASSVFYLNPEDICFNNTAKTKLDNGSSNYSETDVAIQEVKRRTGTNRRRSTCVSFPVQRPSCPPPPPPVNKADVSRTSKNYETDENTNAPTPPDRGNFSKPAQQKQSQTSDDTSSEISSSRSSELHLRFADEPLYQFYAECLAQLTKDGTSTEYLTDSDGYEEIGSSIASRPSAMELITPDRQYRSLWCEVAEVRESRIIETLNLSKQRLQEAKFEVLTSEASYYKSLMVLEKIFACNPELNDESVLPKNDWKILFGNVSAVRKCSDKLLADLENCWQASILLNGLCELIHHHASNNFKIFVKYCSNQVYIDRTLKRLKEQNLRFVKVVNELESDSMCQSLSLHSFLMLPMQRITRLPLLIEAILSKLNPENDKEEFEKCQLTLITLTQIVKDCNEGARKYERYEEMLLLSQQLEFSRKEVKMFSVASSSRWLIRSGPMLLINSSNHDSKLTFTRKLTNKQSSTFYFFLFNDILVMCKKKRGEESYVVFDYCSKNLVQIHSVKQEDVFRIHSSPGNSNHEYLVMLTLLENHEGRIFEMILSCDSESTRQRWLEAISSTLVSSDNPDEKLYEEWDCPQVSADHAYTAVQPDELSLQVADIVKVLKKTSDGWYHGERMRDGVTGWFPGNYTSEIASQHARAKNLRVRYRLLTLSANYIDQKNAAK